ncbi:MAG: hypothetical protein PVJ76_17580, partial [Gemmatimonadota bacterium]
DPEHLLANYRLGHLLMSVEGEEETARAHLEHAAALSPSPMVPGRLWQHIVQDPTIGAEERVSLVTQDLQRVLDSFPDSPGRWAEMTMRLGWEGFTDLEAELEEKILEEYPESWGAEKVLSARISNLAYELNSERPADPANFTRELDQLEIMVEQYLALPNHRDPANLQDAYWTLFLIEKEKPKPDLTLMSELAETWAGYLDQVRDIWADQKCLLGAVSLAQRRQTLGAAKTLLESGQLEMEKFLRERELQTEHFSEVVFDAQEAHIRSSKAYRSIASALVLAQDGSFEEADAALSQARDFDPEDEDAWTVFPLTDFAAGRIKELRADLAGKNGDQATAQKFLTSAEEFYLYGLRGDYYPRPRYGVGWTNPNRTGLRDLFQKRQGSLDGFEDYLASAIEGGLEERRAEVLANRLEDPQPILPFALEDLDGGEVRSESYLGKVVVINFWGTW